MCSRRKVLVNHGWDHIWCTPRNLFLKEFIKGPFVKPKILYPFPFVTLCQKEGVSLRLKQGIPDCWAEYLTDNLIHSHREHSEYESMQKENVEIVPQLRKNYRLYIGQGIPDPWTSYPNVDNAKLVARSSKNSKKNLLCLSNSKKDNCYCCEKKYLFDCPDKATFNNCTCRYCHTGNERNYRGNCKCGSIFRNWVLKNDESKRRKKQRRKKETSKCYLSSSSNSKTDEDCPKVKAEFCDCLRRFKSCSDTTGSDTEESPKCRRKTFSKCKPRDCCCPYVKTVYVKNVSSKEENPLKLSKTSQTENPPNKDSKTVQTDKTKMKPQLKCQCSSKCSHCGFYHCKASFTKLAYPQCVFPSNMIQNPAIFCPYSFPNHFIIQKPYKHDELKKINKKHTKNKTNEEESRVHPKYKNDEKSESQNPETESQHFDKSNVKNIYYCQPLINDFNKLSEKKNYLQRDGCSFGISNCSTAKFVNFSRADSSDLNLNEGKYQIERFNDFSNYKQKYSKYVNDGKMMNSGDYKYLTCKRGCDQATMTMSDSGKNPEINKLKDFEELNENQLKSLFLLKNSNESHGANRKRRKLLSNRKRRRKLMTEGKSIILECRPLEKQYKRPEVVNKEVQVGRIDQSEFYEKNVSPKKDLRFSPVKSKDVSFSVSPLISETLKRIEETSKSRLSESSKVRISDEALKQFLWSDSKFNKTLNISKNDKNTLNSTALKNIVDELLINKKSNEVNVTI